MGGMYSQFSEELNKHKEMAEGGNQMSVTPSTPTPTSLENNLNPKLAGLIDPRSPSEGLSRTPLEIEERNRRIERSRLKNQFNKENNLALPKSVLFAGEGDGKEAVTTPTGPPNKEFPLGFDPRSPNVEISRTPIAFNSNAPAKDRKLYQNFDNE